MSAIGPTNAKGKLELLGDSLAVGTFPDLYEGIYEIAVLVYSGTDTIATGQQSALLCGGDELTVSVPLDRNEQNGLWYANRIYHERRQLIPDSEMTVVRYLFQKNDVPSSNLQVYKFQTGANGYRHIRCYQFYYTVEYFLEDAIFHFNGRDSLYTISGTVRNDVGLDTIATIAINAAGKEFYCQIAADPWYKNSLGQFCAQGFDVELGFYQHMLAWKVSVAGRTYPVAYVQAFGYPRLLWYWNGVIIN